MTTPTVAHHWSTGRSSILDSWASELKEKSCREERKRIEGRSSLCREEKISKAITFVSCLRLK